jgi:ABC-type multidrug transport system fused ATPase/permease subunit
MPDLFDYGVARSVRSPTLVRFLWANRRDFAPGLGIALLRILSIASFPLIFKDILDHRMPQKDLAGIVMLAGVMVALLGLHQFLSVRGAARLGMAVTRLVLRLRAEIFEKIQQLSFTYLDRQQTGRLLAKYAFDTQKIDGVAMPILNSFVPDSLYSLVTLSILLYLNWKMALVILLMLPVIAVMRYRYFERLRQTNEDNRIAQEKLTGTATEFFGALRLVRSYGEEQRVQSALHDSNRDAARSRLELIAVQQQFGAFSWGSIQLLSLLVIAGGAVLSIYGQVTPGTVLAFVAGLGPLMQPIQLFANLSGQYFLGREAYASIRELLDERDTERWAGTRRLAPLRGHLQFEGVRFRYPGAQRDALADFSLAIEPGQKIALVGPSGAGKSTVASLLLGLYAPVAGRILVDGVPQGELDVRWFRRCTALVMQENILLSGSVADNLRFARADASDAEVRQAAERAQALEFIERLPEGFATPIGERGVMLSGGQRQRLSIARALLRDPAVLVLDEPTSALDYESERLIQRALDDLVKGRTVITIAHRLSTIRNADRIVVLDEGRIVETGTFEELSARGGAFGRMLLAQELGVWSEGAEASVARAAS